MEMKEEMDYCSFVDDEEKMHDFHILSREEFLASYSYLSEEEYDLTEDELVYPKILDKLGWSIRDRGERNGEFCCDIAQRSPAGEDFSFGIWFDGTPEDFVHQVKEYAYWFSPDEHIDMWVEARNNKVNGVPDTRTLAKDAEEIGEMLDKLAEALEMGVNYADKAEEIKENNNRIKWRELTRELVCQSVYLSKGNYDQYKVYEEANGIARKIRTLIKKEFKKLGIEMPTED